MALSPKTESGTVALLLVAATALLTWPLVAVLGSAVVDVGDPLFLAWTLAWDLHALATAPLRLFDANIFYPSRWTLAFSDHLLGLLPLAAPAALAGGSPVLVHNVVLLATFPLTGLAMFWLVRELTGRPGAGLVAAVLYAFSHYRFAHLSHVQLLSHFWLPVLLLALHRTVARGGRWRDFVLAGAAFVGQALTSGYYAYFAAAAVTIFAVWAAAPASRPPLARLAGRGAITAVAAAVLLAPAVLPYYVARREFGLVRPLSELHDYAARPASYLILPPGHPWSQALEAGGPRSEGSLFPGAVTLALALAGTVTALAGRGSPGSRPAADRLRPPGRWPGWLDRVLAVALVVALVDALVLGGVALRLGPLRVWHRTAWLPLVLLAGVLTARRLAHRRPVEIAGLGCLGVFGWPRPVGLYLSLTLVGVLLSLGPTVFAGDVPVARPLYWSLYRLLPGFDGLRAPARWALLAGTGLAVLAGYGVAALTRQRHDRSKLLRHGVVTGLVALGLLEALSVPLRLATAPEPSAADRWLASAPPGPVVVLPLYPEPEAYSEARRLLGSTVHWQPLVNGYSGFFPPGYWETVDALNRFPEAAAVARLRELGVRHVVLYWRELPRERRVWVDQALLRLPAGVVVSAVFEETTILEVERGESEPGRSTR